MTVTIGIRVVDASAIAAILFEEPEGPAIALRLTGMILVAPAILDFEMGNITLKKCRRHPELRDGMLRGFSALATLPVELHPVDRAETMDLATQAGLSFYDASYLWLARSLGVELITLDRKLQVAMQIIGNSS